MWNHWDPEEVTGFVRGVLKRILRNKGRGVKRCINLRTHTSQKESIPLRSVVSISRTPNYRSAKELRSRLKSLVGGWNHSVLISSWECWKTSLWEKAKLWPLLLPPQRILTSELLRKHYQKSLLETIYELLEVGLCTCFKFSSDV